MKGRISCVILFCCAAAAWPAGAAATVFHVNSFADAVDAAPGNGICATAGGVCTLRAAVMEVNALLAGGPHTILLPEGVYTLTRAGAGEDAAATGDLDISANVTITGAGAEKTVIDGGGLDRVFDLRAPEGGTIIIENLTVRGGALADADGAGVRVWGFVQLANVVARDNTISGATSSAVGGGVQANPTADLYLLGCHVTGNTADRGGGLFASLSSKVKVIRSAITGNHANGGGGLATYGELQSWNSTLSGNTAIDGGAALAVGGATATFQYVTVAGNYGDFGAAIQIYPGASAVLTNSIVAGNFPENCGSLGTLASGGRSFEDTDTCGFHGATDKPDTDPRLGLLRMNGGGSPTQALRPGSPAIDYVSPCTTDVDQRNIARPFGAACDSGAYEFTPRPVMALVPLLAN